MAKSAPKYALPESGKMRDCAACACRAEAKLPVPGRGNPQGRVLIVGQNPTDHEDQQGRVFVGRSWEELCRWLTVLGVSGTDFWLTNAVKCHTEENRVPKAAEVNACATLWLSKEVSKLPNLKAILCLGAPAKQAVLGKQEATVPITEPSRARITDAEGRVIPVFPLPHPAYFTRAQERLPYHMQVVLPEVHRALQEVGAIG